MWRLHLRNDWWRQSQKSSKLHPHRTWWKINSPMILGGVSEAFSSGFGQRMAWGEFLLFLIWKMRLKGKIVETYRPPRPRGRGCHCDFCWCCCSHCNSIYECPPWRARHFSWIVPKSCRSDFQWLLAKLPLLFFLSFCFVYFSNRSRIPILYIIQRA